MSEAAQRPTVTTAPAPTPRLRRDHLTVALYASFVTWGWFLYAFSPAVPLIARELGISNGLAGLHGTAIAVGAVATGLTSARFAARYGRWAQTLLGGALLTLGALGILVGPSLAVTLPACFVVAIGGNLTISAAQPALTVHHGVAGPAAVTEANGMGAGFGLFAPLAVGASVGLGWGWRPAVAFSIVLTVVAALLILPLRRARSLSGSATVVPAVHQGPAPQDDDGSSDPAARRGFSRIFWLFWAAMLAGVAVEFSTVFWASELLAERTGAPPSLATASVSALVAGMTVSRFVVGPLSLRKAPEKLLLVGYAAAGIGWAIFWLATSPLVAIAGLVVAGLGYGTHYPLSMSLTLRASENRPDRAQARATAGTGVAIGLAPFVLGALSDVFGPHQAFLLVPLLLVVGATAVALGLRSVHRPPPGT